MPKPLPKKRLALPAGHRPRALTERIERVPVKTEVYYEEGTGVYYVKVPDGAFVRFNEGAVRSMFLIDGHSKETAKGMASEIDEMMNGLKKHTYIKWAGAVAGWWPGRATMDSQPVLVTNGPTVITATYGSNTIILDYIERLLGPEQAIVLYAWLKSSREEFLGKTLRKAQAMVLVGARDHGKSLMASLVKLMLGGRQADPTQYLKGITAFNAHLYGSEFLLMDDQGGGASYEERKSMGDGLKQFCGNDAIQCHGKGKTPITLNPFWRLMVLCNDGLENLQVLPPVNEDIADKLIILRTIGRAVDVRTAASGDYVAYKAALDAGISDFLGMLENWAMPAELMDDRFGLKAYHDPWVLEALQTFSPQEKLLTLIDEEIMAGAKTDMVYTARDVERLLLDGQSNVRDEASKLLRGTGSTGKYLSRLTLSHPHRVKNATRTPGGGSARYVISAPSVYVQENVVSASTGQHPRRIQG